MIDHPEQRAEIYKDLVRERYLISKHTNTSYNDTGYITHLDRSYIFEFITDELQKQKDAYDKLKEDQGGRRR